MTTPEINTYEFEDFEVQSYFDESFARRLFEFVRLNKLMGRTAPPRKGFLGMVNKLLWEKTFTFEGKSYLMQGGGKRIAFFEAIPEDEVMENDEADENVESGQCVICRLLHPDSDLVGSDKGLICKPCYDAWFPPCRVCGRRIELPEGAEPDEGPFICEQCWEEEY